MSSETDVEVELARLKSASQPQAIESGDILSESPETTTANTENGEQK